MFCQFVITLHLSTTSTFNAMEQLWKCTMSTQPDRRIELWSFVTIRMAEDGEMTMVLRLERAVFC